jgi:DNA-binding response OmpR family regulator
MDARIPLIVFADRDLEWSLSLRKQLRERGLKVAEASSSRALLQLVREAPPDLVVLGDTLDEIGGRLLSGIIQERSPETRIIRVIGSRDRDPAEPGPTDNVLCTTTRRASSWQLAATIERVLTCAPRGTQRVKAPLVICVDDDAMFLKSLGRIIRRQGYRVLTYEDPEIALEELPLLRPDLLILDVLMPGLSGFEVLDEIRRYYPGRLPVVLLSALDSDAKIAEGKRHGAASYLTKPCVPQVLVDVVQRLVRRSEVPGEEKVPGWTVRRTPGDNQP